MRQNVSLISLHDVLGPLKQALFGISRDVIKSLAKFLRLEVAEGVFHIR